MNSNFLSIKSELLYIFSIEHFMSKKKRIIYNIQWNHIIKTRVWWWKVVRFFGKIEYKVTKKLIAFKIKICSRHPNPTN